MRRSRLPRESLRVRNDTMCERVNIGRPFLFSRSTRQPGIRSRGHGLGFGFHAAEQRADVDLSTAMRTFHPSNLPTFRYVARSFSKEATTIISTLPGCLRAYCCAARRSRAPWPHLWPLPRRFSAVRVSASPGGTSSPTVRPRCARNTAAARPLPGRASHRPSAARFHPAPGGHV